MATVTTVQAGSLFNPATFGGSLPLAIDDIQVQHEVTLETYNGVPPPPSGETIPVMISNTSPSGVASASSVLADLDDFAAWRAFDEVVGTIWHSVADDPSAWIQYVFDTPVEISSYMLVSRSDDTPYAPTSFRLQTSQNSGATWDDSDTRTGITWITNQTQSFRVNPPVTSSYVRLQCDGGAAAFYNLQKFQINTSVFDNEFICNSFTFQPYDASTGGRIFLNNSLRGIITATNGVVQEGEWGPDPVSGWTHAYCGFIREGAHLQINGNVTVHAQGFSVVTPGKLLINGNLLMTGRDNVNHIPNCAIDGWYPTQSGECEVTGDVTCTAGIDPVIPNLYSAITNAGKVTIGGNIYGYDGVALVIVRYGEDGPGGVYLTSWDQIKGPYAIMCGNSSDAGPDDMSGLRIVFPGGRNLIGATGGRPVFRGSNL